MEGRQLLGRCGFGGGTSTTQRTAWRASHCSAGVSSISVSISVAVQVFVVIESVLATPIAVQVSACVRPVRLVPLPAPVPSDACAHSCVGAGELSCSARQQHDSRVLLP